MGARGWGIAKKTEIRPWPRTSSEDVWIQAARDVSGMADGLPTGPYRNRVEGIGNAIVPQVAFEILAAIAAIERGELK